MKNLVKIYKIMLQRWGYALGGIIFSLGFALFSGVSILMVIPLLDNVFVSDKPVVLHHTFPQFWQAIQQMVSSSISDLGGLGAIISERSYQPILESLSDIMKQSDPVMLLWTIAVLFGVLTILKNAFFMGQNYLFAYLQGYTIREVRNLMYHKYLYQSLAFFNKNRIGDSLVRMVNDVQIVNLMFIESMFRSFQDVILIAVYMATAISINSRLFLISIIVMPLFSLGVTAIGIKMKKYARRIQTQMSHLFSYVEEVLSSIKIVKAFSREKMEYERFKGINDKQLTFWLKSKIYHLLTTPLSELNSVLIGCLVLVIGGKIVLAPESTFTFGSFMAFLFAIFSMLRPFKNLTKTYANFRKAMISLDRISEILDQDSEIKEDADPQEKSSFDSQIELKNISFSYDGNREVLKDIDLKINKGEKIALVGSSGSGKTTIANLLTRMYDATSGEINIDGIPIKKIKIKDLRLLFGTVTQDSILFSDTVVNNIAYGSLNECERGIIINSARIANAEEFILNMDNGYDTMLDTKAGNLSGGQKQRLCIARSIVGDPPILIFDEATSALDTEAEQKVQKAIEQATKDRTVVMIAHRLSTILNSDKIVVLDKGKIVGIGTHQELLKTNFRYQTLYNLQFKDSTSG
ncbi:MAG: ABC transporter ATP-binding protein [Candidatus Stygibacter australis]|nr:ABC transporter ATP-binding protein [Candidatus Stygibacter australis]MDP8323434.1 ABC transporter ATP-binding protein [Candidatus Stygibacter australis]